MVSAALAVSLRRRGRAVQPDDRPQSDGNAVPAKDGKRCGLQPAGHGQAGADEVEAILLEDKKTGMDGTIDVHLPGGTRGTMVGSRLQEG